MNSEEIIKGATFCRKLTGPAVDCKRNLYEIKQRKLYENIAQTKKC